MLDLLKFLYYNVINKLGDDLVNKIEKWIDRVFDNCNLIGYDVNIYEEINRYKALRDLDEHDKDALYNQIADRLGFF